MSDIIKIIANPQMSASEIAQKILAADVKRRKRECSQENGLVGIEVTFSPGDYYWQSGLNISDIENLSLIGTKGKTRIHGSLKLSASDCVDVKALDPQSPLGKRLSLLPDSVVDHLSVWDLSLLDWTYIPDLSSRGFNRATKPGHPVAIVDGKSYQLPSYPEEGSWISIRGGVDEYINDWSLRVGRLESGFYFDDDRPSTWNLIDNLWLQGYWGNDWSMSYEKLAKLNMNERSIVLEAPYGNYHYLEDQRFRFINVFEELKHKGNYYLDRELRCLYVFLDENSEGCEDEVELSLCKSPLLSLHNVKNIRVEGISYLSSCGNGIEAADYQDVSLHNLYFNNIGATAVRATVGYGLSITSSDFSEIGSGGVYVRAGDRRSLTSSLTHIKDCHFSHIASWTRCYDPAVFFIGVGLEVEHCLIHDHPHTAILFCGNDVKIRNSEFYRCCYETGDAGCIYTGGDLTYRGNEITGNYLHHLGGVGFGSRALYNDDCVCATTMDGNYFFEVSRALFIGGGKDFSIKNNVCVNCQPAFSLDARGLDDHPVWSKIYENFKKFFYNAKLWPGQNEVPAYDDGPPIDASKAPYIDRYPELKNIDDMYRNHEVFYPSATIQNNLLSPRRRSGNSVLTDSSSFFINFSGDRGEWRIKNNFLVNKELFEDADWGHIGLKSTVNLPGVELPDWHRIGLLDDEVHSLDDKRVYSRFCFNDEGLWGEFLSVYSTEQMVTYSCDLYVGTGPWDSAKSASFHVRPTKLLRSEIFEMTLRPREKSSCLLIPSSQLCQLDLVKAELIGLEPGCRPAVYYSSPKEITVEDVFTV